MGITSCAQQKLTTPYTIFHTANDLNTTTRSPEVPKYCLRLVKFTLSRQPQIILLILGGFYTTDSLSLETHQRPGRKDPKPLEPKMPQEQGKDAAMPGSLFLVTTGVCSCSPNAVSQHEAAPSAVPREEDTCCTPKPGAKTDPSTHLPKPRGFQTGQRW